MLIRTGAVVDLALYAQLQPIMSLLASAKHMGRWLIPMGRKQEFGGL